MWTAAEPTIALDKTSLAFNDQNVSTSQIVNVNNTTAGTALGTVTVIIENTPSWLSVDRSGTGNNQTLTVSVGTPGLAPGAYQTTVSVSGGGAGAPASFEVTLNTGTSIDAPTGLQAASPQSGTVELTWSDNAGNETGFVVERRSQGGTWSSIATPGADTEWYTDNKVAMGAYEYRVKAVNGSGESGYSPLQLLGPTPLPPGIPPATPAPHPTAL